MNSHLFTNLELFYSTKKALFFLAFNRIDFEDQLIQNSQLQQNFLQIRIELNKDEKQTKELNLAEK